MTTNDICRIYRADETAGGVKLVGAYPCMRQDVKAVEVKKYGEEKADKAAVYIPYVSADVREKDFVFFGNGITPTDKELFNALRIMSITRYDYGSPDMRHIKLGVK